MDLALSIADSSLNAQMAALSVTSENVANAQTPGYVEQNAELSATIGSETGTGMGVQVTTVSQANNALLTANNLQAQGALASVTSSSQVLTAIQNIFPLGQSDTSSTTDSTNSSIAGQLANFWSAWDTIAQDPSAAAGGAQVVDEAQGIVTTLNEASSQLTQVAQNTRSSLADQVSQVNSLLAQAAQINGDINTTVGAAGNPAQLQDQMNQVVNQLATIIGVQVQTQSDGTDLISSGGVALVQGVNASTLSTNDDAGTYSIVANNGQTPVAVTSGTISGLLSGLNQYIPEYQSAIDGVANSLSSTVNNQLAAGYTPTGVSGSTYPLFVGNGAGGIAVNSVVANNPSLLAVASTNTAAGANDGSNAQTIAEFATSTTGPDAQYQTLIQNVGSANQSMNAQVSSQTAFANQASTSLAAVTGVNINTELTSMMSYQQNYEASAKLLSTVVSTLESLMSAV